MYNQSVEDYIRSIIGYSDMPNNNTFSNNYNDTYQYNYPNQNNRNIELESLYPETYKIIYPMVKKACNNINGNINETVIETITDEIYSAFENQEEIRVNISLTNATEQNRSESTSISKKSTVNVEEKQKEEVENRNILRRNNGIRDLIKILILRELLGRPHNPRPPMPPHRPPFPGGPNGRPPIRPRFYEDIYEY